MEKDGLKVALESNSENNLVTEVHWQPRNSWRAVKLLHQVAAHTATAEGFKTGRLSIAAVGATAMATLHKRFLGAPGPTDVLSFDLNTDRRRGHIEAEIIVCTDVARRMTQRSGRSLQAARAELALYVVHGILHVAGFDDHDSTSFQRMHKREDEILKELGLGPVFLQGAGVLD